jgi:membrane associated rhomboid family serine protease
MRLTSSQGIDRRTVMTVSTSPESTQEPGATRPLTSKNAESARRGRWDVSPGDAQAVLAEARKALFVMVGFLAIIWVVQIFNWADHYHLSYQYGIHTRSAGSLPDILTAPFLHLSWTHIEGNSGPLFVFGFLAAYRGVVKFLGVTVFVLVTSGIASWLFLPNGTVSAGASGIVFGYFGYIMVRGFFDRHLIDMILGAVMALCFAYQFSVLLPHQGISWEGHVGGLVGGVAAGWIFRDRRPRSAKPAAGQLARTGTGKSLAAGSQSDLLKELGDLGM